MFRFGGMLGVLTLLGCSSGDDGAAQQGMEADQACSHGATTKECDACAQTMCPGQYAGAFRPSTTGGSEGSCAERARCTARCDCGDVGCYELCTASVRCVDSLSALLACQAVSCADPCAAALVGIAGPCIELAGCCRSATMPSDRLATCVSYVEDGDDDLCKDQLANNRLAGYCK